MPIQTPIWKEDEISQVPALQLLQNLGYQYISPERAKQARLRKESNVILEEILDAQLRKINRIRFKGEVHEFSDSNIRLGIQAIKNLPFDGLIRTNQKIYDLLTLGKSLEQIVAGDRKSFTLKYFDFEDIENNAFHVTEEFPVEKTGSYETLRPDLVLFVNGIPLALIECKRPDIKDPIDQAISQMIRNQRDDGIPKLFLYSQVLLATSKNEAYYATTGTRDKFWSMWRENGETEKEISRLINIPLPEDIKYHLFFNRFHHVRDYFDALQESQREVTEQDRAVYSLLRPERLMELFQRFIVFDAGEKKIARYPQYFAVKRTLERVKNLQGGKRQGGVLWHTQGSGKSLTMIMMAKAIAMEPTIKNPRVVVVTDRIELDEQIEKNFKNCGAEVKRADTGKDLAEILAEEKSTIVTTIINKFDAVLNKAGYKNLSSEIFVLVDEGHRSQYGIFNTNMGRVFPKACFIAFTGTPLMKSEKSTAQKFGGIIEPAYTIEQAVKDKAVVPLLYEGRLAFQDVNQKAIDSWFERITEDLSPDQKKDLKKKFSTADQLNKADQKIRCIAYDVSDHFSKAFEGTALKGQLTAPDKATAIKYKKYFDECGLVSTEVLISPPDTREGFEEVDEEQVPEVIAFWKKMMTRFGNAEKYDKQMRNQFKNGDEPEIIIVVDKLLTGFDVPRNTVLYITRSLKEHALLQAIARVNRLYEGKEYGQVIDYYGVLGKLDEALDMYSSLDLSEFDSGDLVGTLKNVSKEVETLPQKHSDLWELFKTIPNRMDVEQYERALADEALRAKFKDRLSAYARTFALALSTVAFMENTPPEKIATYKKDLSFFEKLRLSVIQRYSEAIDYKEYAKKIEKLIDTYVSSDEITRTTQLVNIFDKESFNQAVAQAQGDRAKAETILSRTKRTIHERMNEDPAFYAKFSKMIEEAIAAYESQRLSDSQLLKKATEIMEAVRTRTGDDVPESLKTKDVARAFYGITLEILKSKGKEEAQALAAEIALKMEALIIERIQVDWALKPDVQNAMKNEIEKYFYRLADEGRLDLSFEEMDKIIDESINVAKHRYSQ